MRARFANCVLDSGRHELTRDGSPRPLQPKAFALLEALVAAHPSAAQKQTLYDLLWPGLFVEEGNLHNLVADVRAAIGDDDHSIIRTVHRVGYVLAVPVAREQPSAACLVIGSREWPLVEGDNVIGRDMLATPDVSRRHACVSVRGNRAFIRDLESKNGTFVGGHRVDGETELENGDEIVFGRTRAIIWVRTHDESTVTAS